MDAKKSNKIRDIVRLQQLSKKWRKLAKESKSNNNAAAPNNTSPTTNGKKSIKFLKRTLSFTENSVPKGCLAVCVGEEQKRFVIPMEYLSHQAFQALLREAEEVFGFNQTGVLRIPCEVPMFENILKIVEHNKDLPVFLPECRYNADDFMGYYSSIGSPMSQSHPPNSPLCMLGEEDIEWTIANIIINAREEMQQLIEFDIKHIKRDYNVLAHTLAKWTDVEGFTGVLNSGEVMRIIKCQQYNDNIKDWHDIIPNFA